MKDIHFDENKVHGSCITTLVNAIKKYYNNNSLCEHLQIIIIEIAY